MRMKKTASTQVITASVTSSAWANTDVVTQRGLTVWHVESAQRKLLADLAVSDPALVLHTSCTAT